MAYMKVLMMWQVPAHLRTYFAEHLDKSIEMVIPRTDDPSELISLAGDVEAMVGWRPSPALFDAAPKCRMLQIPGVGVQHLTSLLQRYPQITLCNNHDNTYFTAQHALSMLLALTNRIITHDARVRQGRWGHNLGGDQPPVSYPLLDRTIGIAGLGALGSNFARFVSGFDVRLIGLRNDPKKGGPKEIGQVYGPDQMDEFLRATDILVLCVPQTPDTEGMITRHHLELLGPEGLVVNMARGSVIIEQDLFDALEQGVIAGAALDVWWDETPKPGTDGLSYPYHYPFHQFDNVVMSPHRGSSPIEDVRRWRSVVENLGRLARGEELINKVDISRGY